MIDNRYLPICKACRWYDMTQPQCFDGHLQYSGKLECNGFEPALQRKPYEKPIIIEVQNEKHK